MMRQGDGYKYRGKGLIHLTFKEHYERASIYAKKQGWIDTDNYFVNNPDSITTDGKFALLSAVYFWNSKELYKIADTQNENNTNEIVKQITKKVNGGENALSDRQQVFHKIQSSKIFEEFLDKRKII
ncbi:hypothetical protein HCCG_02218 [Helicobacter cinaedi CCUG 18818 = ATCC BAA-847]|uniref:Uncharacterized protein n=2 Tax=Helicobacter cinaedi CCUG 18818 = ATCC BAA-847 TaxID=537971 RepID=A0ABN0BDE8_9HELI|nr:hypothetical protein HCCG_02218 [Helicobacter cinaedi CCUG 18818 = ATCC BAA-847]